MEALTQRLMERGAAAAGAGKKAEARHFFSGVLDLVPDHPQALLWLAYLAGGGRPSLAYLVRLLEADPTNQRARTAIRWARARTVPQTAAADALRPRHRSGRGQRHHRALAGLEILMLVLVGALATVAFALNPSPAVPTRVPLIVAAASATPTSVPRPTPLPSATPTSVPRPTPTIAPVPSSTLTVTSVLTATVPRLTSTPTLPPPTATVTSTAVAVVQTPAPATPVPFTALPTVPIGDNFRWIDVDLTHQRLIAYQGETPLRTVLVSTGLPRTPTVTGRFKIYVKHKAADMSGPGYYLRNVPYVMYFYGGYAIHGTYWHTSFGQPMSHGCVNLPTSEAEWLYNWAGVGTLVVVHY